MTKIVSLDRSMRVFTLALLLGVSCLGMTTTAKNKSDLQIDLMKYIPFIQEWTSLKYSGQPLPKIKIVRHDLVQAIAYGDDKYMQFEKGEIDLPVVNATYDLRMKTIYVSNQIDAKDPLFEVAVVHELVHYLQDVTGYTASLNGHLACTENDAYDVQMLWQKEHGIDLENLSKVYQLSLYEATKCNGSKSSAFPSRYNPDDAWKWEQSE